MFGLRGPHLVAILVVDFYRWSRLSPAGRLFKSLSFVAQKMHRKTRSARRRVQKEATSPSPSAKSTAPDTPSSTTSSKGVFSIPRLLWATLAEDIEESGGIQELFGQRQVLASLLNRLVEDDPLKQELYGRVTDYRREQIQKKVWKWQKLCEEGTYEKDILARYKVRVFKFRNSNTPSAPSITPSAIPSDTEDWTDISDKDSSGSDSLPTAFRRRTQISTEEQPQEPPQEPPVETIAVVTMEKDPNQNQGGKVTVCQPDGSTVQACPYIFPVLVEMSYFVA
jgi:hypothetical protein